MAARRWLGVLLAGAVLLSVACGSDSGSTGVGSDGGGGDSAAADGAGTVDGGRADAAGGRDAPSGPDGADAATRPDLAGGADGTGGPDAAPDALVDVADGPGADVPGADVPGADVATDAGGNGFSFEVAPAEIGWVAVAEATTLGLFVNRADGYAGPVSVAATGLPEGVTAAGTVIAAGETYAQMDVVAGPTAVPGDAAEITLVAVALDGGETHTDTLEVVVTGAHGTLDEAFTCPGGGSGPGYCRVWGTVFNERAEDLEVLPDGRIVVGGIANQFAVLKRLNVDGTVDGQWGPGAYDVELTAPHSVAALARRSDDGFVIAGGTGSRGFLAGFAPANGAVDTAFGDAGGLAYVDSANTTSSWSDLLRLRDGRFAAAGTRTPTGGLSHALLRIYSADGAVLSDNVLAPAAGVDATASVLALKWDDTLWVAGHVGDYSTGDVWVAKLRVNADGTIEPLESFGEGGYVTLALTDGDDYPTGLLHLLSGHSLVVSGNYPDEGVHLAFLTPTGALGESYGDGGIVVVPGAAPGPAGLLPDGSVAMASIEPQGEDTAWVVRRFGGNGVADFRFGTDGVARVLADAQPKAALSVAIQADGRILVAGMMDTDGHVLRFWP